MQSHYLCDVQLTELPDSVGHPHRQEMSRFGQPVDDNPDGIVTLSAPRQTTDEVHRHLLPLPLWYLKWLKFPCWPLVFDLDLLTSQTLSHKLSNVSLHPWPPILTLDVLVHLGTPWMNSELREMKFSKNLFSISLRYEQFIPQQDITLLVDI